MRPNARTNGLSSDRFRAVPVVLLVSLMAVEAAALAIPALPALAQTASCGQTITSNTYLSSDLTCSGAGIVLGGNGVTLNCRGYTISGPGASSTGPAGVSAVDRISDGVRNCVVVGFGTGIAVSGGLGFTLVNDNATGDYNGYSITGSNDTLLQHDIAKHNTVDGIYVEGHIDTLSSDTAYRNGADGIVVLGSFNKLLSGTAAFNVANGFVFNASNGVVDGNDAIHNGNQGFRLDAGVDSQVSGAYAIGNGGQGFNVADNYTTIKDSMSADNAYGFYIGPSAVHDTFRHDSAFSNSNCGFCDLHPIVTHQGDKVLSSSAIANTGVGFQDASVGSGTGGTANQYNEDVCFANVGAGSTPAGLC